MPQVDFIVYNNLTFSFCLLLLIGLSIFTTKIIFFLGFHKKNLTFLELLSLHLYENVKCIAFKNVSYNTYLANLNVHNPN